MLWDESGLPATFHSSGAGYRLEKSDSRDNMTGKVERKVVAIFYDRASFDSCMSELCSEVRFAKNVQGMMRCCSRLSLRVATPWRSCMRKCRYKSLLAEIRADSDDEIDLVIPCQRFGYIDDADLRVEGNCHAERLQGLDLDLAKLLKLSRKLLSSVAVRDHTEASPSVAAANSAKRMKKRRHCRN